MKILISTDIEGVAGVLNPEQTRMGNGEYERARRLMTQEANAAIAGAFDAGAEAVYINDSHGDFRNLLPDLLDPRAQAIQGKPRRLGMMAGVDLDVDAAALLGYHAKSKTFGILAHTINSMAFARIAINDVEYGEAGLYGALAGEFGVPVAFASGDDVFIAETRPLMPHATFVQTKTATGLNSGCSLAPEAACAAIRSGLGNAVREFRSSPFRPELILAAPLSVRVQTQTPALADLFCLWPSLSRCTPDAIRFEAKSMEEVVRTLNALSAMSSMLR